MPAQSTRSRRVGTVRRNLIGAAPRVRLDIEETLTANAARVWARPPTGNDGRRLVGPRRGTLPALVVALILLVSLLAAPSAGANSICPNRYAVAAGGSTFQLPYCANRSLQQRDASVHRLVVVIHGTNRNASDYESWMETAAHDAGVTDALIVAPQFLEGSDGPSALELRWTSEGWKSGDESQTSPSVSSYAVVDQMIRGIVGSGDFPNLDDVVVAGHSAGGQFTERYAATNRVDGTIGVPMRYVVANPSSYLYLSPERPVSGSTTQFAVPSSSSCPGYDTYKYGLNGLNPYAGAVGAAGIRSQFESRHVAYLLGSSDTDPNDSSLDKSCEGEMQGPYRLARGQAFYNYLGHVYGSGVYATQSETIVQGVAHDANGMFCSPEGRGVLFAPIAARSTGPGTSDSGSGWSGSGSRPGTPTAGRPVSGAPVAHRGADAAAVTLTRVSLRRGVLRLRLAGPARLTIRIRATGASIVGGPVIRGRPGIKPIRHIRPLRPR